MPAEPNDRLLSVGRTGMRLQNIGATGVAAVFIIFGILAWIPGVLDRVFDSTPAWLKILPIVGLLGGALFWAYLGTLCTVYLTPHGLRIIRGTSEMLVPMNQVKKVERAQNSVSFGYTPTTGRRANDNTIAITFRERTPFGTSITFMAPRFGDPSPQALIEELRRRAGFLPSGESRS